jgi:phosphatidate cytidylyltransferase
MQHIKRWLTSLVIVPLLLWLIIKGDCFLIAFIVAIVSIFALKEYFKLIFTKTDEPVPDFIWVLSCLVSIFLVSGAYLGSVELVILSLFLNFLVLVMYALYRFPLDKQIFNIISRQFFGIIYIPLSLSFLIFIRQTDDGILWLIWLLSVVFINDTCAFYAGTFFGKRHLAPNISPNKTIEGSLGGIAGAVLVGFIVALLFFHDFFLSVKVLPCALLLAIAGQIGDLFESSMKRASMIKDSGSILPGHGGILDRIDGLLTAIPVFYAYLVFIL